MKRVDRANSAVPALAAFVLGMGLFATGAPAASFSWTGAATDFNWNTAGNWNPSGVPNGTADTAAFQNFGIGVVNLPTPRTVGTLSFANSVGYYNLFGGDLTLNNGLGGATLNVTGGAGAQIANRLVASNLNATISSGTLRLTNTAAGAGANSITGSFNVGAGGTLRADVVSTSPNFNSPQVSNPLGTATVNLNGGTLWLNPVASSAESGLVGKTFTLSPAGATTNAFPGQINYTTASPLDTSVYGNVAQTNVNGTIPFFPGGPLSDFGFQLTGRIRIDNPGLTQFLLTSDDGSRMYIDGVLVISNEGIHGSQTVSNIVNLTAGYHDIRIELGQQTAGSLVTLNFLPPGGTSIVVPVTQFFTPDPINLGNNVNVTGNSTINLAGNQFTQVGVGTLTLNNGSTLNLNGLSGKLFTATSTVLTGLSATVDNTVDFNPGKLTDGGIARTFIKEGTGRLVMDNISSGATANVLSAGTVLEIRGGTLAAYYASPDPSATNPLGQATVRLNGGNMTVDTLFGNVLLDNNIAALQNARLDIYALGDIAVPASGTTTIGSVGKTIDVSAGATLTINALTANVNTATGPVGATVQINSAFAGAGDIILDSTPLPGVTPGTLSRGNFAINSTSTGFTGSLTLNATRSGTVVVTSAGNNGLGTADLILNGSNLTILNNGAGSNGTINYGNDIIVNVNNAVLTIGNAGANTGNAIAFGGLTVNAATFNLVGNNGYTFIFNGASTLNGNLLSNADMTFNGTIGGSGNFNKTGSSTVFFNSATPNTYLGTTTVTGGALIVSASSSLGQGDVFVNGALLQLGSLTNVNVGGGATVTVNNFANTVGILAFSADVAPAAAGLNAASGGSLGINAPSYTLSLNMAALGNGSMYLGATTSGTYNGATLGVGAGNTYRLGTGGGTLTVNGNVLVGAGNSLTVGSELFNGGGTVVLTGSNTFGGGTRINPNSELIITSGGASTPLGSGAVTVYGTVTAAGANGRFANAAGTANTNAFDFRHGGRLVFDNTAANNNNRWADSAAITLEGSGITLLGFNNTATSETIGALTIGAQPNDPNTEFYSGHGNITLARSGVAGTATLNIASITRGATFGFGLNGPTLTLNPAGTLGTTEIIRIISAPGNVGVFNVDFVIGNSTGSGAAGGNMAPAWVVNATDNSFVTYSGTSNVSLVNATYINPVTGTTFATLTAGNEIVDVNTATPAINVNVAGASIIWALRTNTNIAGNSITIRSGGLIVTGTVTLSTTLNFSDSNLQEEAFIYVSGNNTATLSGNVQFQKGFTKFGTGTLIFNNVLGFGYSPTFTPPIVINAGTVQFLTVTPPEFPIVLNGGNLDLRPGSGTNVNLPVQLSGLVIVMNRDATINAAINGGTANGWLALDQLIINGPRTLTVTGVNATGLSNYGLRFTGPTILNGNAVFNPTTGKLELDGGTSGTGSMTLIGSGNLLIDGIMSSTGGIFMAGTGILNLEASSNTIPTFTSYSGTTNAVGDGSLGTSALSVFGGTVNVQGQFVTGLTSVVTVSGGLLDIAIVDGLAGTGAVTVNSGGTLNSRTDGALGTVNKRPVTVNSGGTLAFSNNSQTPTNVIVVNSGAIISNIGPAIILTLNSGPGGNVTLPGAGTLTFAGTGAIVGPLDGTPTPIAIPNLTGAFTVNNLNTIAAGLTFGNFSVASGSGFSLTLNAQGGAISVGDGVTANTGGLAFTALNITGNGAVNVRQNGGAWKMNGGVTLNGTGQVDFRAAAVGANGDAIVGTGGLGNLTANAGTGVAKFSFGRQSGTVINRLSFAGTILNSDLTVDPELGISATGFSHIGLGNVQINGSRLLRIEDAFSTATSAFGVDITSFTGNAASVLRLAIGSAAAATGAYSLNRDQFGTGSGQTMLGQLILDTSASPTAVFTVTLTSGAQGVGRFNNLVIAPGYNLVLSTPGVAGDSINFSGNGLLSANDVGQPANTSLLSGYTRNGGGSTAALNLAAGTLVVHTVSAATAAGDIPTLQGMAGSTADLWFTMGANLTGSLNVGTGQGWRGISVDRTAARTWVAGNITAFGDFTIQNLITNTVLTWGQAGTPVNILSGGGGRHDVSIVNGVAATTFTVALQNAASDFSGVDNFVVSNTSPLTNTTTLQLNALNALGGSGTDNAATKATVILQAGGRLQPLVGNATAGLGAINSDVIAQAGGVLVLTAANSLNGTGVITMQSGSVMDIGAATVFAASAVVATNSQIAVLGDGVIFRLGASNTFKLLENTNASGVFRVGGGVTQSVVLTLDSVAGVVSGMLTNDGASRVFTTTGITIGAGGAAFASSTGFTLTVNAPITNAGNSPITIGAFGIIDIQTKAGTVQFNAASPGSFGSAAITVVANAGLQVNGNTALLSAANDINLNGNLIVNGLAGTASGVTVGAVAATRLATISPVRNTTTPATTTITMASLTRGDHTVVLLNPSVVNVLGGAGAGSEQIIVTAGVARVSGINMVAPAILNSRDATFVDYAPGSPTGFTNIVYTKAAVATAGVFNTSTTNDTVDVTAALAGVDSSITIGALRTNSNIAPTAGVASTITIRTGGLISVTNAVTITNNLAFGAEAVVFTGNTLTLNGALSGTNGLIKVGTAVLALGNVTSTLSGGLYVRQGTIQANADYAIPVDNNLEIDLGATVNINGFNQRFGSLSGWGTLTNANTTAARNRIITINGSTDARFDGNITTGTVTTNLSLVKNGAGTQVLTGLNTYAGTTSVLGGTLVMGSAQALGTATSAIIVGDDSGTLHAGLLIGGAFTLSRDIVTGVGSGAHTLGGSTAATSTFSGNITLNSHVRLTAAAGGRTNFTGVISDNAPFFSVSKTGAGTVNLTGANTYRGGTVVQQGTLLVNNTSGSGTGTAAVIVNIGATLGGNGTMAGPVTVSGILSPGNSAGNLTSAGGLTLTSTSTYLWELSAFTTSGPGVNFDQFTLTGGQLSIVAGATLLPTFSDSASSPFFGDAYWGTSHVWNNVINLTGSATNPSGQSTFFIDNSDWSTVGTFSTQAAATGGGVDLIWTSNGPVPEPATWALFGLAGLAGAALRRRNRKAKPTAADAAE